MTIQARQTIAEIRPEFLRSALRTEGIMLDFGAFSVALRSRLPELVQLLQAVYAEAPFQPRAGFVDTEVELHAAGGFRRWARPLAHIEIDGIDPFEAFPRSQLLPHFEWGVNWAFANMMNTHLLLHAGAVEIDGHGVLLIARPGSGKSTLTAGLVGRGARLLSDEFGVVRTDDSLLLPMTKPIALKNQSIAALRAWSPQARIGPVFVNTRKGDLAHHAVPADALARSHEPAQPHLVIFPQFEQDAPPSLQRIGQASAFMELAANSFNYTVRGAAGFETVAQLVEQCPCYRFRYGSLTDAVATVFELCGAAAEAADA